MQYRMQFHFSGVFGLWFDEDLYRGRSHSCRTFDNETLSEKEDFICTGLEAWAFVWSSNSFDVAGHIQGEVFNERRSKMTYNHVTSIRKQTWLINYPISNFDYPISNSERRMMLFGPRLQHIGHLLWFKSSKIKNKAAGIYRPDK